MTLQVSFGQGGKPAQWYLPGTDPTRLPFPDAEAPVADALTGGPFDPPPYDPSNWAGSPMFGGAVTAFTSTESIIGDTYRFDVVGGWNSVKNAFARSDRSETVRFDGFVHVDIELGGARFDRQSIVEVIGAKRGNIVTGDSSDIITIEMLSNETRWTNEFRIATGGGDDVVTLRGLDRAAKLQQGDATYAAFTGTTGTWDTSGENTRTFVDLGDGNDTFFGHASADTVIGGAGDDFAAGGDGIDTFVLSGIAAGYAITSGSDRWFITDIDPTDGDDGADQITGFERIGFGDGTFLELPPPDQGTFIRLAAIARGEGGFKMAGASAAGFSVAGPGDLNGDGLDDLLIGAPGSSDPFAGDPGFAFLVFGKADGNPVALGDLFAPGSPLGFAINGGGLQYGLSVAGPGDVNGDGVPDLLIGNFASIVFESNPINPAATVVFGTSSGGGTPAFRIATERSDAFGAFTVAAAGDVNGDGLADLLVAAGTEYDPSFTKDIGGTYVVFGKADGADVTLAEIDAGTGSAGFTILGAPSASFFHQIQAVAGAGDVNLDGYDDLLISDSPYQDTGAVFLVFGKPDTAPVDLASIAAGIGTAGLLITAGTLAPLGISRWAVAAAGDVNGDDRPDMLLGIQYSLTPYADILGKAFVVFGSDTTAPVDLAAIAAGTSDQGFMIEGVEPNDEAGFAVAGAGDLNGDGLADLLIGAPGDDSGANEDAGAVYVVFGKADGDTVALAGISAGGSPAGLKILGETAGGRAGQSVAAAGDVNDDGLLDILVGAPGVGSAYVVFGQADWLA